MAGCAGQKRKLRISTARAFVAKAFYDMPSADMLIGPLKGNKQLKAVLQVGKPIRGFRQNPLFHTLLPNLPKKISPRKLMK